MNASFPTMTDPCRSAAPGYPFEEMIVEVEKRMTELSLGMQVDLTASMALQQISSGGKRVRARLALHACSAFGLPQSDAIAWASAIELLHNATLIHDDIQDGDIQRRGKPTIWAEHGQAQAINAGDFMLMLPFIALQELAPSDVGALSPLLARYATHIVRGQVNELSLKATNNLSMQDYLAACEGKTGMLLALPIVGAAVLAGYSMSEAERFGTPFVELGILFQLQDDLIDLFGDKGRETPGCDIYEGKVTTLLISHLNECPEDRTEILRILDKSREDTNEADVSRVRDRYLSSGSPQKVLAQIKEFQARVFNSPLLLKERELHQVAKQLEKMALAPIAHLFSGDFS
jgi:geranylgeranyl diphosphate synthase type I